jgi:hypothetical protein
MDSEKTEVTNEVIDRQAIRTLFMVLKFFRELKLGKIRIVE